MKHLGNIPFCMFIVRTFSILNLNLSGKDNTLYIPFTESTKYEVYFIQI